MAGLVPTEEILQKEGGGRWNALYGQAQEDPNSPFYGTDVTKMTVNQVAQFTDPSGPYAQYVKSKVGRVATPTGGGQIVGTTLRNSARAMGLTGDEIYTPELQQRMMQHIYDTQGRGAWEALKGGGGGMGSYTMSTMGGPPVDPYTPRKSVIQQLLGGEGMKSVLNNLVNPAAGANPALEQARFGDKAKRFAQIAQLSNQQQANTNAPISWLQVLGGAGASAGEAVMSGASSRAGEQASSDMTDLMQGPMTPDRIAQIAALDPQYGQQVQQDQARFQQQQLLQGQSQEFQAGQNAAEWAHQDQAERDRQYHDAETTAGKYRHEAQVEEAQRKHELELAKLKPQDRTAMEDQLIAAGFDPNGPPGPDGLNEFQREMRKEIDRSHAGGGANDLSITFDENNNPVIRQGAGAITDPATAPDAGGAMGGDVSGIGKIEPGMAQGVDQATGGIKQAPVPGSPEDVKRQEAATAATNAANSKLKSATDVLSAIGDVEKLADSPISTGMVGKAVRDIGLGGNAAYDIQVALNPVIANMGFDRLQQMRAASPTGAALGQVTERENTLLQSTIKSLDPNASKPLFKANLAYVKAQYDAIVNVDPNDPASVANYEAVMGFPLEDRGKAPAAGAAEAPAPAAVAPAGKPVPGTIYEDENGKWTVDAAGNVVDVP